MFIFSYNKLTVLFEEGIIHILIEKREILFLLEIKSVSISY